MADIDVKDALGATVPIRKPPPLGRATPAASVPVAVDTDTKTALDAIATQVTAAAILAKLTADPATQTTLAAILAKLIAAPATAANQTTELAALSSIDGHVDGLETLVAATNALLTTTNAKDFATQATLAALLAKVIAAPATEAKQDSAITQETAINTVLGLQADAASASTTIKGALRGIATALGITALDLGSGTGGSRTLRFFQDTAQFIGGAGTTTSATQRATIATDDAVLGANNETAPVTDTASSGLNGRLQRIAQRITSFIALLPASLGAKLTAASFSVTVATDDAVIGGTADAAATAGSTGSLSAKLRAISRDIVANIVLAAGSNLIGRTVPDASAATGGIATTARMASAAASTNATNVKTAAGRVYQVCGKNNAAYDVFLVLYDAVTNPPVPGTTAIRKKMPCPAGQAFVYEWPHGLGMATGIGYAFTKLVADADTTVLVAADITGFNMDYV